MARKSKVDIELKKQLLKRHRAPLSRKDRRRLMQEAILKKKMQEAKRKATEYVTNVEDILEDE